MEVFGWDAVLSSRKEEFEGKLSFLPLFKNTLFFDKINDLNYFSQI